MSFDAPCFFICELYVNNICKILILWSLLCKIYYRKDGNFMLDKLQKFMYGRYGIDVLGKVLAVTAFVFMLLSSLTDSIILRLFSYIILGWCLYRFFSKRTVYRANENMKFKKICYFKCPQCKRTVKVPRKKGKIEITCPFCRCKFIKKT